jgi:hypothetical protein
MGRNQHARNPRRPAAKLAFSALRAGEYRHQSEGALPFVFSFEGDTAPTGRGVTPENGLAAECVWRVARERSARRRRIRRKAETFSRRCT